MRLQRLRGRKVCERVLRKGAVWKGRHMSVRWLPGPPLREGSPARPSVEAGAFASSKLDKSAVKRNRMRRRCREALRVTLLERSDLPTLQLFLCPRSSSLTCDFRELLADIAAFLASVQRRP